MTDKIKLNLAELKIFGVAISKFTTGTKFFLYVFCLCLIAFSQLISSNKTCLAAESVLNNSYQRPNQFIRKDGYILIKVFSTPPFYFKDQKKEAFRLLKPYLTKNIYKASVVWQKTDFSYGKMASIPNTYICEYLKNKIKCSNFISLFTLQEIEPELFSNSVSYNSISDSSMKKTVSLNEEAELYRLNGKNDSAERIYLQILEINPNETIAIYWLAKIYKTENKFDKAEVFYKKALSIDPSFWAASEALYELKGQ